MLSLDTVVIYVSSGFQGGCKEHLKIYNCLERRILDVERDRA